MIELLTLGLAGAAGYMVRRSLDVGAELALLRGHISLIATAAQLPAGTEIDVVSKDGTRWLISVGAAAYVTSMEDSR